MSIIVCARHRRVEKRHAGFGRQRHGPGGPAHPAGRGCHRDSLPLCDPSLPKTARWGHIAKTSATAHREWATRAFGAGSTTVAERRRCPTFGAAAPLDLPADGSAIRPYHRGMGSPVFHGARFSLGDIRMSEPHNGNFSHGGPASAASRPALQPLQESLFSGSTSDILPTEG